MNKIKGNGFTLMEAVITVLVLGVMTSLALPRYNSTMELFRSKEGVQMLQAVLQAQLSADVDIAEGRMASYNNLNDLDVTIPVLDFFNAPDPTYDGTGAQPTVTINAINYPYYARIVRTTNAYTLYVQQDGRILCDIQVICSRMQYDPW